MKSTSLAVLLGGFGFSKNSRTESSGGMEWLGGIELHLFRALNFQISEPDIWRETALSAEFQRFFSKFRPLKKIFWTLENPHSIRHQSIPPLRAGR